MSDCDFDCEVCENILEVCKAFKKNYENLITIIPYDTDKIIGLDIESFEGLSPEEIVSAKHKDSQCNFLGKEELLNFILNILLYFYKFDGCKYNF